jgi:hypothetical protein
MTLFRVATIVLKVAIQDLGHSSELQQCSIVVAIVNGVATTTWDLKK